eukprot:GHVR01078775.1.p1 GENE.GHVR01078775.1~~GHVR01078775.1.p1  ORF type:complete len:259 (+),score=87.41 GHVR01078775.1:107-883(+)
MQETPRPGASLSVMRLAYTAIQYIRNTISKKGRYDDIVYDPEEARQLKKRGSGEPIDLRQQQELHFKVFKYTQHQSISFGDHPPGLRVRREDTTHETARHCLKRCGENNTCGQNSSSGSSGGGSAASHGGINCLSRGDSSGGSGLYNYRIINNNNIDNKLNNNNNIKIINNNNTLIYTFVYFFLFVSCSSLLILPIWGILLITKSSQMHSVKEHNMESAGVACFISLGIYIIIMFICENYVNRRVHYRPDTHIEMKIL